MEPTDTLTVLFADISGSTRIVKQHGDLAAHAIIQRCLERVAKAVSRNGGVVVSQIGDELLCTLPDARRAIIASIEIQDEVKAGGCAQEYPADLRMHIGFHYGPVLVDQGEIFGDTIHTAKRMVDLAKADQILTTHDTLEATGSIMQARWRRVDELRIKGYDSPVEIFEIIPEDQNVTMMSERTTASQAGESYTRCRLRYGARRYVVDASTPVFTIGRQEGCDLPILAGCVSREHGRLEYQKGRIIFIDHSTNGTFITEEEGPEPVLVHREQRWLRNHGLLRFGDREDETQALTLEYRCETNGETTCG